MTDIIYAPLNKYFKGEKTLVGWVDLVFRFYPKKKAVIEQFLADNSKAKSYVYMARDQIKLYKGIVPDTTYKKPYMSTFVVPDDDEYFILILGAIYRGFSGTSSSDFDGVSNDKLVENIQYFIALWFADYIPYEMWSFSWDW